jgi:hypothetical protein
LNVLLIIPVLKGFDDAVMRFEESCFWTVSIVECFFFKKSFGNWLCFRLQVKKRGGGVAPTLWGPLERASLNHWTRRQKQSQLPKRCL